MANPIPHVAVNNGAAGAAPKGAIPIALFGATGQEAPAATTTVAGVVKKSAARPNLAADADLPTTVTAFNDLLTKLRTAGILA